MRVLEKKEGNCGCSGMGISKKAILVQTYNFERVCNDPHRHELLAVVAAVHHERVGQALDNRALGFAEPLDSVSTCRVRDVNGRADLNVVAGEGHITLA